MAKKKKQNNINNIETTLVNGNVNIFIKSGKRIITRKTVHNAGTLNLFYGSLLALSGTLNNNYLPNYLSVGFDRLPPEKNPASLDGLVNEPSITRNLLTKNVGGITKTADAINDIYKVSAIYQGVIPYSDVLITPIVELGIFGTVSGSTLLARIELKEGEEIILRPGQSIVVQWEFSLQNLNRDS